MLVAEVFIGYEIDLLVQTSDVFVHTVVTRKLVFKGAMEQNGTGHILFLSCLEAGTQIFSALQDVAHILRIIIGRRFWH